MSRNTWIIVGIVARVVVGGLFMLTAYGKLGDLQAFASEIQDYKLAPVMLTNAMAIVLPWLELFTGLLLILTICRAENRWMIGLMLAVFTVAKGYSYFILGKTACGCGGDIAWLAAIFNNPQGMLTNVVLIGLLFVDYLAERRTSLGVKVMDETAGPAANVA